MLPESVISDVGLALGTLSLMWAWRVSTMAGRRRDRWTVETGAFADSYQLPTHMRHNREEIARSSICGCVWCEQLFRPAEIRTWRCEAEGETAVCPRCGREAVVGSGAGFTLTPELLHRSHTVRFQERPAQPARSGQRAS